MGYEAILIGIGGNLASEHGPPLATCRAAVAALADPGEGATATAIKLLAASRWYRSPPDPPSSQPWYVNGVIAVATALPAPALLARLHALEARFGRRRAVANAARPIDLDLLAYETIVSRPGAAVVLPHPRLHRRAFVLLPLAEIAPGWRHPRLGVSVEDLIAALPPGQGATPFAPALPGVAAALVSSPPETYNS